MKDLLYTMRPRGTHRRDTGVIRCVRRAFRLLERGCLTRLHNRGSSLGFRSGRLSDYERPSDSGSFSNPLSWRLRIFSINDLGKIRNDMCFPKGRPTKLTQHRWVILEIMRREAKAANFFALPESKGFVGIRFERQNVHTRMCRLPLTQCSHQLTPSKS